MSDVCVSNVSVGDLVILEDIEQFFEVSGVDTNNGLIDVGHWDEDDMEDVPISRVIEHYKKQ